MNGDGGGGGGPGPGGASFHFSGGPGGVDPRKIFEQFFGTGDPFAAGDDDDGPGGKKNNLNFNKSDIKF